MLLEIRPVQGSKQGCTYQSILTLVHRLHVDLYIDLYTHDHVVKKGNSTQISGYFDTKYVTILRIEQILHKFEDQKLPIF